MAAIGTAIGSALSIGGTLLSARAYRDQAVREKQNADFEAQQLETQAGQEQAASERVAFDERRQADYASSKALAAAAASGGGTGGTVTDVISRIAQEGSYRSSLALFEGMEQARQMKLRAFATRAVGEQRASAYDTKAKATLLSGAASLFGKYGGGIPNIGGTGGGSVGGGDAATLDAGSQGMSNIG